MDVRENRQNPDQDSDCKHALDESVTGVTTDDSGLGNARLGSRHVLVSEISRLGVHNRS